MPVLKVSLIPGSRKGAPNVLLPRYTAPTLTMRSSLSSSRASQASRRAREGWFAQVDDDEDVGKIVTDEIPTGLYKMGMEALLKDYRDARIKKI